MQWTKPNRVGKLQFIYRLHSRQQCMTSIRVPPLLQSHGRWWKTQHGKWARESKSRRKKSVEMEYCIYWLWWAQWISCSRPPARWKLFRVIIIPFSERQSVASAHNEWRMVDSKEQTSRRNKNRTERNPDKMYWTTDANDWKRTLNGSWAEIIYANVCA